MSTVADLPDEDYHSASDEDFNPDTLPAGDILSSSSDDEDEPTTASSLLKPKSKKRKDTTQDLDFDNSGDEATISKQKKKKRKTDAAAAEDDEGGEGGLIKTRAQRKAEVVERKAVVLGQSSVDIDAVWAQMTAKKNDASVANEDTRQTEATPDDQTPTPKEEEETININRTYTFAGKTQTESRTVPVSSAEAKLYLAQQSSKPPITGLRRPTKRVSIFATPASIADDKAKALKLNTLMKSKMDWAQHVDQEGIGEELEVAKRDKRGYLGKMEFLGRMDAKREGGA